MKYLLFSLVVTITLACRKENVQIPTCILAKIDSLKNQPPGTPAYSVYQYWYRGQKVYFFPEQCCDQYSYLYDGSCQLICNPTRGLLGADPACADFFSARENEVLVWEDPR